MYQGEELKFYLRGNEVYDLTKIDFSIYIYRDDCPSADIRLDKADCEEQSDGSFLCCFKPSITAKLPICTHTIEIHDKDNDVIYVYRKAFDVKPSATAKDLVDGEEGDAFTA